MKQLNNKPTTCPYNKEVKAIYFKVLKEAKALLATLERDELRLSLIREDRLSSTPSRIIHEFCNPLIYLRSCTSLVLWPSNSWNLVGLFTTIAASAIAWLELKQYQSLIQAYSTACMELTLIKSLSNSILCEDDFIKYVLDSENAISREHTMWLAQRRK